jgi:hypothetical protein
MDEVNRETSRQVHTAITVQYHPYARLLGKSLIGLFWQQFYWNPQIKEA